LLPVAYAQRYKKAIANQNGGIMNVKLVEALAQIVGSLTPELREMDATVAIGAQLDAAGWENFRRLLRFRALLVVALGHLISCCASESY